MIKVKKKFPVWGFIIRLVLIALAAVAVWAPYPEYVEDRSKETQVSGKVDISESRSSFYHSINSTKFYCNVGIFSAGRTCNLAVHQKALRGKVCTARFANMQNKLFSQARILVALTCEGDAPGDDLRVFLSDWRLDLQNSLWMQTLFFLMFSGFLLGNFYYGVNRHEHDPKDLS